MLLLFLAFLLVIMPGSYVIIKEQQQLEHGEVDAYQATWYIFQKHWTFFFFGSKSLSQAMELLKQN